MKKKKTKVKKEKVKKIVEEGYPKKLSREQYFACPIWHADQEKYVDSLNKAPDSKPACLNLADVSAT